MMQPLLTQLEYVNERRAKDCCQLDNNCITYLNQLPSFKFLHLKSTAVTINGLLQLTNLPELKELMFSADDVNIIRPAMLELKALLPGCAFTVNGSPWIFESEG